ncbi:MAG: rRNA maturation RNase YbeY [Minisyncoccia bacterium]
MSVDKFNITNKTRSRVPSVPFVKIKDEVLGKKYNLSLVFIGKRRSKKLNFTHRGKDKATNILSFTLDKSSGEIFITPEVLRKEMKKFGRKYDNFVAFLFIHGLLHLKGFEHGSRMESEESKLCKQFGV